MDEARLAIVSGPLDVEAVLGQVAGLGDGQHGAIVTFVGTVRSHNAGRQVTGLEYEAYEPLAIRAFERIADEVAARWSSVRLAIRHRVGNLQVGETSVVIAASSAHRAEAFAGCRYVIERIKQIAPIWKREHYDGGEVWVEGATVDPEDEAAREEAFRRACT
jgi:molybdopterin synthase catalytic subunit